MIPLEQAFEILDDGLHDVRLPVESMPARGALGRHLAGDHHARLDLPPFDKSAMDGYAIPSGDERSTYRLLETVAAGQVGRRALEVGTAVKVMTGAPVPPGTGRVVMQERTEEADGIVKILEIDGPANICRQAEDVRTGDLILSGGARLGPLEIANLVSCGITDLTVHRRARAAVISTGDEIVDAVDLIAPGKIMNSNGPMLASLAESFGLEVALQDSVADDLAATVGVLRAALEKADIVMLSGGVSVGEFDFVERALEEIGLDAGFTRLAVKPGKPTVFAQEGSRVVFGFPGNPVSSFLMFHLFALRAVARMSSAAPLLREMRLRLGHDFERRKGRRLEFVPCTVGDNGTLSAVDYHGSGHLAAVLQADGFFQVPAGVRHVAADAEVTYVPLPRGTP